jgi:hypothetical protein
VVRLNPEQAATVAALFEAQYRKLVAYIRDRSVRLQRHHMAGGLTAEDIASDVLASLIADMAVDSADLDQHALAQRLFHRARLDAYDASRKQERHDRVARGLFDAAAGMRERGCSRRTKKLT